MWFPILMFVAIIIVIVIVRKKGDKPGNEKPTSPEFYEQRGIDFSTSHSIKENTNTLSDSRYLVYHDSDIANYFLNRDFENEKEAWRIGYMIRNSYEYDNVSDELRKEAWKRVRYINYDDIINQLQSKTLLRLRNWCENKVLDNYHSEIKKYVSYRFDNEDKETYLLDCIKKIDSKIHRCKVKEDTETVNNLYQGKEEIRKSIEEHRKTKVYNYEEFKIIDEELCNYPSHLKIVEYEAKPLSCVREKNFTVLDIETPTSQNNSICQIGIIVVKKGDEILRKSIYVQPPYNIYSDYNIKIHGITPNVTANSPLFPEVWEKIKIYIENNNVICHNSNFDINVINKVCDYYNIKKPYFENVICTYKMSRVGLKKACEIYNIPYLHHHDALADAEMCLQLYYALTE